MPMKKAGSSRRADGSGLAANCLHPGFVATRLHDQTLADDYFKKFLDAGLRTGVCIRPQQLVVSADGSTAQQVPVADPMQLLIAKATFAHNRWGTTLFYVDSNVNATDPNPIDASIFQKLAATFPDSLFMPEHSNPPFAVTLFQ